jgi:predicted small lipoprotein YifL
VINPRLTPLLTLAVFLAACGVKAPPHPPASNLPQKVRQLTQTVTPEGEVVLSWLPPETDMAGRPLKALGGFQIEMADHLDDEHYCSACPPLYQPEPVDRLPARTPPPGRDIDPGPYEWRRRLEPGHVYHFRVAAVNKNGGVHPEAKTETVVRVPAKPN